jgi:hypothetical protein
MLGSIEWEKVQYLMNIFSRDGAAIPATKLFAIFNPALINSFVNHYQLSKNRFKDSPEIFFGKTYTKALDKVNVISQFDELAYQFTWNKEICKSHFFNIDIINYY